jgi:hypothetical protein
MLRIAGNSSVHHMLLSLYHISTQCDELFRAERVFDLIAGFSSFHSVTCKDCQPWMSCTYDQSIAFFGGEEKASGTRSSESRRTKAYFYNMSE